MDFKTNIVQDPTIPDVLKKSLINFKRSSVHSSSAYNMNSNKNKVPTPSKKSCVSTHSFPENFKFYALSSCWKWYYPPKLIDFVHRIPQK